MIRSAKDAHGNKIKVGDEVRFYSIDKWEVGTIVRLRSKVAEIVRDNDSDDIDFPWCRFSSSVERI